MKMKKNLYAMLAGSALLAACQTAPQQTVLKGELTGDCELLCRERFQPSKRKT